MWQQQLNKIKDHILRYNPYFSTGFSNTFIDEETGQVFSDNGNDYIPVFPEDRLGDYFYLRTPQKTTFADAPDFTLSDCQKGIAITGEIFLIAVVRDADADRLVNNLANTVQAFDNKYITIKSAIHQKIFVVEQEMAKVKEEKTLMAALARLKQNMTIVSLSFALRSPFQYQKLNCMTKPCKTC